MIVVHYSNRPDYKMYDNTWKRVPDKDSIIAVSIVRDFDLAEFRLDKPEGRNCQFFAQRIGYSHVGGRNESNYYEEQIGMLFDDSTVEILEVGRVDTRYTTTIEALKWGKISFDLLGLRDVRNDGQ